MRSLCLPLCVGALVVLAGCTVGHDSYLQKQKVELFTTRYLDLESGKYKRNSVFSNRETVLAVVRNLSSADRLYRVEFLRHESGEVVFERTVPISAHDGTAAGPAKPLPAGKYLVKVSAQDLQPVLHHFSVLGF